MRDEGGQVQPDDGEVLKGQLYDQETGIVTPFRQVKKAYINTAGVHATGLEGNAKTEQHPIDAAAAEAVIYDAVNAEQVAALMFIYDTTIDNVRLDAELKDFQVLWENGHGDGDSSDTPGGASSGSSASLSLSSSSDSQGSAFVIPVLSYTIKEFPQDNIPCRNFLFYLPDPVTRAGIITRLEQSDAANATILPWPAFKAQPLTFVLKGQRASVAAGAKAQESVSISVDNITIAAVSGHRESYEISPDIRVERIPRTLHAAFASFTGGATLTDTATADASANIDAGTNFPSVGDSGHAEITVHGSVTPTSIPATSPTANPVTGLYLFKYPSNSYKDSGYSQVLATVIDMSYFA